MEKYHLLSLNLNVEQNDPNKEKELFLTLSLLKADDMRYVFVKVSELDSIKEILRKVLNNIEGVDDFSMGF